MSRSVLIPSAIVCLGLAMAAVAQTRDVAQPATGSPGPVATSADLATTVKTLEERVAKIERQLAARMKQETLGRGLVPFQTVVANLRDETLTRYVRVDLVLAIEDGQKQAVVDALSDIRPNVKDWLLSHLADKTVSDINGSQNQDKLREEIQAGINLQFKSAGHPQYIKAVLFDEINVQ
ncbi:MAG: flagellar basal body-associated FliL family protein [Planctomycetaceae bacterium]